MGTVIGLDIGQRRDPTAIAVVELDERVRHPNGDVTDDLGSSVVMGKCRHEDDHWLVRHLERLSLGTAYPAVVSRVVAVYNGVVELTGEYPAVWMDATGVGIPILDLLKDADVPVRPVFFTHGDQRTVSAIGEIRLGKAWLVSRLQALLQTDRLHLPKTAEAKQLAQELLDYEIKIDANANDTYGAFRVGAHDDLVTALGLAVHKRPNKVAFY